MSSIIIGIDPGTRITGYAIVHSGDHHHLPIDYGCISPPLKHPLPKRYQMIYLGIDHLLNKYKPQALAVETQYVHKNVQSAIKLGMARGMAILAAAQRDIPVFEYSPTKTKLAVAGNGHASKAQVQGMIRLLFKLSETPPEDAADALAIAVCHIHSNQMQQLIRE